MITSIVPPTIEKMSEKIALVMIDETTRARATTGTIASEMTDTIMGTTIETIALPMRPGTATGTIFRHACRVPRAAKMVMANAVGREIAGMTVLISPARTRTGTITIAVTDRRGTTVGATTAKATMARAMTVAI